MWEPQNSHLQFGSCRLDLKNKFLWHDDKPVDLPLKALDLLCLLIENEGSIVSKETIWQTVWQNAFVEETNLTHNIYIIRKKLRELGEGDLIQTVPRRGYRFTGNTQADSSVIIERRAITQTLIEELPSGRDSTRSVSAFLSRHRSLVVAAVVLLTAALGLGAWRLNSGTPKTEIKTLAVLPFVALNDPHSNELEGIGIADVLITRLSNVKDLRVRPTSAVTELKGQDPIEAGKKLGVDAVLEGMLYRQNGSLRVTAKLIRTDDNYVLWAGQFERSSKDELQLQNEIAVHVVNILASNLSSTERDAVEKRFTENTDTWQTYSRARIEWNKRTWASMLEAQRLFRNAIALDPNFALAYAGLADTLATGPSVDEAEILIEKALELDPTLAEPYASRGFIHMFHRWDWDASEAAFTRSIELNSNYATAHHWYATLLAIRGRNDEAKVEMLRALELNPTSPNFLADLGQIYYFNREYSTAKELCQQALEQDSEFIFAHEYLHDIYLLTGEYDKAVESELEAQRINMTLASDSDGRRQRMQQGRDALAKIYREKGIVAFEEKLAGEAGQIGERYLAATRFVFTGKTDKVLDDLDSAYNARGFLTVFLKADPLFDPVRQAPRYRSLLAKMDLE